MSHIGVCLLCCFHLFRITFVRNFMAILCPMCFIDFLTLIGGILRFFDAFIEGLWMATLTPVVTVIRWLIAPFVSKCFDKGFNT